MRRIAPMITGRMAWQAGTLLLLAGLAGCQTDALSGPSRTAPEGPVTSLESPAGMNLPSIPVVGRTEVDLVEEMILHRAMYARYLRALSTFYLENGFEDKAIWAQTELNDLRMVKPYRYILDAEVPVASLQPTDSVAEADKLYEDAMSLMKTGGHGVPVFYNQQTMKEALAKLKALVDKYPNSDKIDDAAFYIGEIHKEYFEEKDNQIAVQWYQRAIDWNPDLPHPARFQMAVVYDYRLHDRDKALELYQEVVERERFNRSNVDYASKRIRELTPDRTRHAPGEPVAEMRPEPSASPAPSASSIEASPAPPARVP